MKKNICRVNQSELNTVLDFGMQPLGNGFIDASLKEDEYFYSMQIGFSESSRMLQLIHQPEPEKMFHGQYAFYSGTSSYMVKHFKEFASTVINSCYLSKDNPFVVELGCNDGIMLKNFAEREIRHLGIEPSLNVAQEANKHGVRTCSGFFTEELAEKILKEEGQADAFLAANVMCHIPDIRGVVRGIKKLLKPNGVVMFEDPYLGDVITKTSYDQIYDEHVFLFSALSIQYLFNLEGMELIDLQPQVTHGGSMRYVLGHVGAHPVNDLVAEILAKERAQGLDCLVTFEHFSQNVEKSKLDLLILLKKLKLQGKTIAGYAATSKSTTVLNYCGIGPDLISYICDTTLIKQGKLSPGVHIPVVPYKTFKTDPPDYALLLAWNHADEIMAKEKDFLASGGLFIVHVPMVKVL